MIGSTGLQDDICAAIGCPAEVGAALAAHAVGRQYPARAVILRYGDRLGHAWLVVAGRAQALVYGLDGQMVLVHEYRTGDFFGTVAATDAWPVDADVVAADPTRAACVPAADFVMLVDRHRSLGLLLVRSLLEQLRAASARMVDRTTLSAPGRVYAELLRLARLGDGAVIRPAPVHAALAVRVQSTRETVSRSVSALERRGIVRRENDALVIVAPGRLEELVV
ncbi:MAG: Crp/Fnr family transcriptional regulator [Brevundimonas sp.]|uniref:Crp/Fnr family transcriptional regulator n=1 Tax=Brevundimonas sp. TaxID=1871086 RepID=UPI002626E283|nr:Crp/Fnr family transcriptional regulator [Brevundimonas sp.]MDI6623595.1 Crp/Fnr family transcriptional regulator [Brevundimonas sp.]